MKRYRYGDVETGIGMMPGMQEHPEGEYVAIEDVLALIVGNVAFLMRLRQLQASLKCQGSVMDATEREAARDDVADVLEAILRTLPDQETLAASISRRVEALSGPMEARTRYPNSGGASDWLLDAGAIALARTLVDPRPTPAADPDAFSTRMLAQLEQLRAISDRADAGDPLASTQLVEASLGLLRSLIDPQRCPAGPLSLKDAA